MHKVILVDLYNPIFNSNVDILHRHLKNKGFNVYFLPLSNLIYVVSALVRRYFYNEDIYLIIAADRLPERLISALIRPRVLLAFQHGIRSTVRSKIDFRVMKKAPLYLIYSLGIFVFRSYDFFYIYDRATLSLYPRKIIGNAKIRVVKFTENFVNKVKYDPHGKILFIDQSMSHTKLPKVIMHQKISLLEKIAREYNKTVCVKIHPRNKKNKYIWNEYNEEPISCAVGFSSSLLFNFKNKVPIFTLLEQEYLPFHLKCKAKFIDEIFNIFSKDYRFSYAKESEQKKDTLFMAIEEELRSLHVT